MKNTFYSAIILIIILGIIYVFLAQSHGDKRDKELYNHFNKANIQGEIEYCKIKHRGSLIKIVGDDNEYIFYPILGLENEYKRFYLTVKRGDKIAKLPSTDTLKLIQKDGVLNYTFRKTK